MHSNISGCLTEYSNRPALAVSAFLQPASTEAVEALLSC
jgi:hypothetical protein